MKPLTAMLWKVLEMRLILRRIADTAMTRHAVLFVAVFSILPTAGAGESPSADTSVVSASNVVLSRDAVVPLTVVTRVFPEITQEMSTGQNSTAVGKPKATRSVIYANNDNSKKVTITVDQYASPNDASAAYREAIQRSRTVPGFKPISAPNLGPHAFIGTVTQGTETHIGLGAVHGTLIIAATLAGYDTTPGITANLISLAHDEENVAAATVTALLPATKEKIDALVQSQIAEGKTPGIAVAIAKNGHTIYENAAGVRDVSSHAPMLMTTPQAIGSITKQFTASAIFLLQQEKKLSIDDKLSKYVPEYVHGDEITLRQMLNMVSGISDNDPAIYGDHLTEPITREQMFANLNKLPLMWKPGTHMVYTNTNYNLLGLVVERVSGQPYLAFLREHIFSPLGMSSTSTIGQPPPDMATGYHHEKPGQPVKARAELHPDFSFGTGNLVSTTQDLLKWDAGLLGQKVLDDASLRSMFTVPGGGEINTVLETDKRFPVMLHVNDGKPTIYAMGWMLPNPHTKWHGGHTFLFEASNALFSDGYSIAIIGNVRDEGGFEPENVAVEIHNLLNPKLKISALTVVTRQPSEPIEVTELE
jgi:CubicO group peptidase (beta-lactamase class C family)